MSDVQAIRPEVRDVLVGIKEHLSKGWTQGELKNETGVCLYGALVAIGNIPITYDVCTDPIEGRNDAKIGEKSYSYSLYDGTPEREAVVMIANEVGIPHQKLALWNDAPERTVDDIVSVIDAILLKSEVTETESQKEKALIV